MIENKRHEHKCFYKYTTAKVAKIALINGTLRWSSPVKFNDPFDVPRELHIGFQEEELLEALANEIGQIIENPEHLEKFVNPKLIALVNVIKDRYSGSEKMLKIFASELRSFAFNEELANPFKVELDKMRSAWARLIPQFRIICLSEINDSMPMWAHYADNHRGVMLGLECIEEIDSPWLNAKPVIYQDDPPLFSTKEALVRSITGQQPLDYKGIFMEYLYIKTTAWAYEKEWRVATVARSGESGDCSDWPINKRNFGAVYLGKDISEEDEKDFLALMDHELSHVSIYKAALISRERSLRFNRVR